MSVPAIKPAPQMRASHRSLGVQRSEDGVAQVKMKGATTKPARALGTHQPMTSVKRLSQATMPA